MSGYEPLRGAMSAGELRTRIAIADLGERDLNELLSCSARVLGEWRVHGTFTAERRVQVRRLWPELGRALDDLDRGPRL